jgi:hypothetical protein
MNPSPARLWILSLFALAACDKSAPEAPAPAPKAAEVAHEPTLVQGTIRGVVEFLGQPPPRPAIAMGAAPECSGHATPALTENVVVRDGKLANVLVTVKEGLPREGNWPAPPEPAVLDQQGCLYVPHVLALRTGQKLRVRNSDPATHNVNAKPARSGNEAFNQTHPPGYPFFAVSSESGEFELRGLPPGRYRLEALHETLGRQAFEAELGPSGGCVVHLYFVAKSAK